MIEVRRGDVVLVNFPFVASHEVRQKRRPALVVQSNRYNRRRAVVILAAVTSTRAHREIPAKVLVPKDSLDGGRAGLRIDSVVDCQTLMTIPREEITAHLGRFTPEMMARIDLALANALDLRLAAG